MVSLTENESRTIEFLIRNFFNDYNINQLSRELKVSPMGIYKILKKLENQSFLISNKQGNNIFYKINYESKEALDACIFALTEKKTTPYIRSWINDLEKLKEKTKLAILFGSILRKGKEARDIDVLLVFDKEDFNDIERIIKEINKIRTKRIHAIYQTKQDLVNNIKIKDKAILEEIRTGVILWGRDILVEAIKNGQS